ncbi:unnamed protein product [Prorocentrum cordatum]|nr:unnamed protein product [Polarella glacialis]
MTAGAALVVCLFGLRVTCAGAFRVLKPETVHWQASDFEMQSVIGGAGEADLVVLGAAGVLLLAGAVHGALGHARLARASALMGGVGTLYALGLLDETVCVVGSLAAALAVASRALARARPAQPAKKAA